mmetsp:Transcript_50448/g.141179  ORF Transcript_50448/g.141179 Transcript_50448/m.141179 type:complete len:247 (-) Transcript_50448:333-1073(-)
MNAVWNAEVRRRWNVVAASSYVDKLPHHLLGEGWAEMLLGSSDDALAPPHRCVEAGKPHRQAKAWAAAHHDRGTTSVFERDPATIVPSETPGHARKGGILILAEKVPHESAKRQQRILGVLALEPGVTFEQQTPEEGIFAPLWDPRFCRRAHPRLPRCHEGNSQQRGDAIIPPTAQRGRLRLRGLEELNERSYRLVGVHAFDAGLQQRPQLLVHPSHEQPVYAELVPGAALASAPPSRPIAELPSP